MKSLLVLAFMFLLLSSCGRPSRGGSLNQAPPVNEPLADESIVIGRASLRVTLGDSNYAKVMNFVIPMAYANPATQPVTVVLAPNTQLSVSDANFTIPALSNTIINFGTLDVTSLYTNDLKKCGPNANQKCTKALIRVYTSDAAGAGFWNDADGYGVPLLAGGAIAEAEVGLGAANAHMVQQINIPTNKNTVTLADFGSPEINIKGNFANAGSGTYSTTINVEFALAP
jgi:hypothetical protein